MENEAIIAKNYIAHTLILYLFYYLCPRRIFKEMDQRHRTRIPQCSANHAADGAGGATLQQQLEYERIQQQLAFLNYQINPHFLMNTLNNIHALIAIDPERAQDAVVELSRLLRYVLYEGDHQFVPLQREIDFLGHYIRLMRIRFTADVDLHFDVQVDEPQAGVPPLVLATFIENAFKHGVSYVEPSFVDISIRTRDGRLFLVCRNSKHAIGNSLAVASGGVGLRNARQRLNLLFPDSHRLHITETAATYSVELELPLNSQF